jgi:hypothetical protein
MKLLAQADSFTMPIPPAPPGDTQFISLLKQFFYNFPLVYIGICVVIIVVTYTISRKKVNGLNFFRKRLLWIFGFSLFFCANYSIARNLFRYRNIFSVCMWNVLDYTPL